MSVTAVKIVFSAKLGSSRIQSQTVSLGGIYPDVEIEDLPEGIHHFKILKNLPNAGEDMLASAVAEATQQIEIFWNVLSYLRDTNIRPLAPVQYELNGVLNPLRKEGNSFGRATIIASVGPLWFTENVEAFHKEYDYDLLKRYNFARALDDPISRFLSLYAMLASITNDRQSEIDALIEREEPTVSKSYSPKTGQPESLFTRLRNELAHHREGVSVFDTHDEIRLHVARFEWIVGRVLRPRIQSA